LTFSLSPHWIQVPWEIGKTASAAVAKKDQIDGGEMGKTNQKKPKGERNLRPDCYARLAALPPVSLGSPVRHLRRTRDRETATGMKRWTDTP